MSVFSVFNVQPARPVTDVANADSDTSIASEQVKTIPAVTLTIAAGFEGIAASMAQVADSIRKSPADVREEVNRAQGVYDRFGDMVRTAYSLCEDGEKLTVAVSEMQKTADYLGDRCCGAGVGKVVNSYAEL